MLHHALVRVLVDCVVRGWVRSLLIFHIHWLGGWLPSKVRVLVNCVVRVSGDAHC